MVSIFSISACICFMHFLCGFKLKHETVIWQSGVVKLWFRKALTHTVDFYECLNCGANTSYRFMLIKSRWLTLLILKSLNCHLLILLSLLCICSKNISLPCFKKIVFSFYYICLHFMQVNVLVNDFLNSWLKDRKYIKFPWISHAFILKKKVKLPFPGASN